MVQFYPYYIALIPACRLPAPVPISWLAGRPFPWRASAKEIGQVKDISSLCFLALWRRRTLHWLNTEIFPHCASDADSHPFDVKSIAGAGPLKCFKHGLPQHALQGLHDWIWTG